MFYTKRHVLLEYCCVVLSFSDTNVNTGHSEVDTFNKTLAVQTPAVNFVIQNSSVSLTFYTILCNSHDI